MAKKPVKERKAKFETSSHTVLKDHYGAKNEKDRPGHFPFTRGIHSTMYRSRFWTMRQYAGFASAQESNKRYHYLLKHGQKGLSVAFDLPTQMGYDSDHSMSRGEVGKVGVAIDSIEDMKTLLRGIPLSQVSTSMTINATASILLGLYIAVAKSQRVNVKTLRGTIQNDVLKEYIARGTYIYPPKESLRIITDIFKYCKTSLPKWNTISISGYHIREAGSSAVQEVAFTLANGITYVEAALKAGLTIDDFASRLSFFFNVHNNFLEEIAKFRAARRLWAKILKKRFKAKLDRSCMLRFHAQTAGSTLTAQQPHNNIARVTLQALAAVMGGTQSLHTNSFDEALSLPTQEAVRVALRTQQILANESGVGDVVDPLGGSHLIENLTDEIEHKAKAYIDKIDTLGGVVNCIQKGFLQREIQKEAFQYQKRVESGDAILVGVNTFTIQKEKKPKLQKISPQIETKQIQKLKRFKKSRNQAKVKRSLANVSRAAKGKENLMPRILEAVESKATVGEIADAMREVFGDHRETITL